MASRETRRFYKLEIRQINCPTVSESIGQQISNQLYSRSIISPMYSVSNSNHNETDTIDLSSVQIHVSSSQFPNALIEQEEVISTVTPPSKISTVSTSTTDCDILYEKLTSCSSRRRDRVGNCDEVHLNSSSINYSCYAVRNQHCTYKLEGSEYPNYVVPELALFQKLQSGITKYRLDIPVEKKNDLGTKMFSDNNPVAALEPENDSDSTECEILWIKRENSLDPGADESEKELDINNNLETCLTAETQENCSSKNDFTQNSESESRSTLLSTLKDVLPNKQDNIPSHECDICHISLTSSDDLKIHLLLHVHDTAGEAVVYKRSVLALQQLNRRYKNGKLLKLHNCGICRKEFLNHSDLRYHLNIIHADTRPYQCQLCPKNYTQKSHLSRHERTHWK